MLAEQSKHSDNYSKLCMIKYDEMNFNGTSSFDLQCEKIYLIYFEVQAVVCGVVGDGGGNHDKGIHFFTNMPHLIKLLINHLLDQGIYSSENRLIDKEVLEKLIDADSSELKLAPKLRHNISNVSGTERMKVAPTVKLLSRHTAFLAKFVYPDRTYYIWVFQSFDDFYDIFNFQISVEELKPLKSGFGMKFTDFTTKKFYKVIERLRVLVFSKKS